MEVAAIEVGVEDVSAVTTVSASVIASLTFSLLAFFIIIEAGYCSVDKKQLLGLSLLHAHTAHIGANHILESNFRCMLKTEILFYC